jgi:hypothetical protein
MIRPSATTSCRVRRVTICGPSCSTSIRRLLCRTQSRMGAAVLFVDSANTLKTEPYAIWGLKAASTMAEPIRSMSRREISATRPILPPPASSTGPIRRRRCSSPAPAAPLCRREGALVMDSDSLVHGRQGQDMKQARTHLRLRAASGSAAVAPAGAQDGKAGDLVVTQAWSRATPAVPRSPADISPSRTRAPPRIG